LVKVLEDVDDVVLLQAVLILKHRGDKLIKVYFAIFVHIYAFENSMQFFAIDDNSLLLQSLLYFIDR
jgi:hypothetical protein